MPSAPSSELERSSSLYPAVSNTFSGKSVLKGGVNVQLAGYTAMPT